MRFDIKEYSILEIGQRTDQYGNPHQEDSIYPPQGRGTNNDRLFMVCDGMGGHEAGEIASSTVCNAISSYIKENYNAEGDFTEDDLRKAISVAYDALDAKDNGAEKKMGTTLALLKLYKGGYMTAHMGDSRIYHIRPGYTAEETKIIHRTEDHSLVNHLVQTGEMTPKEALVSPKRNVITRAMQPNMERRCKADIFTSADIRPGDYFMLCSDGMLEHMSDYNIQAIFSKDGGSDKNKVAVLTRATANNRDNHSAVIVHIIDVEREEDVARSTQVSKPKPQPKIESKPQQKIEPKPVDKVKPMKTRERQTESISTETARPVGMPIIIKIVLGIVVVMSLFMFIYYAFIHTNETLQTAGTAIDNPMPGYENGEKETYGYEITEQDIRNEAEQIAPEEPAPEEIEEEPYEEVVTEPAPATNQEIAEEELLQE